MLNIFVVSLTRNVGGVITKNRTHLQALRQSRDPVEKAVCSSDSRARTLKLENLLEVCHAGWELIVGMFLIVLLLGY